ncbi:MULTISPECIES: TetR/AcrR family transcriptional regulator [Mycobacteriaceae]|uniref:TetR family transcriptional regulator n=1 Tax=Mycolicibacterium neoaurum VKM Ac-1815D TaxID=700508 RepID=V5XFM8_MYCNE|nr:MULTISPECIES: TetR/AcrR family transcriptional regulator [Mycobacteriaceae]AHC26613.1 TetR family transcriptional regulator [Mycolicibacterium neoaurum VKM Ac-1815D]AMO08501.1 TetR family transcriptional regulator [Mycolicibacterium neoaurum]AXK78164.1 TetR/AcrR family transcriptional regulator [Mycolicibacterium neoaurum]KJQ48147.1 TetR family transcriptional regulator [Mycolicibacterium neoaurum]KUM06184.1 TetR family transcriptional regulator [Mycolicibacterium neoaurum]
MAERTDAARSRSAIIDAARRLVTEPGELKLSAVARAAGVGQATLYRHFATRDDLMRALYDDEIDELVSLAYALVEQQPPVAALRKWFGHLAAYARVKFGVMAAVEASVWRDIASRTPGKLGDALGALLAAGREAGVLRADVDARDVILLSWFLAHVDPDEWAERTPRLLGVLLDGLSVQQVGSGAAEPGQ